MVVECLVFDSEQEGLTAADKIWENIVIEKSKEGDGLVGNGTINYNYDTTSAIATGKIIDLTPAQIIDLYIYGYLQGIIQRDLSGTHKWAVPALIYEDTRYYFEKPDNAFMTGVVDYVEEPFNHDWLDPNPPL